MLSEGLLNLITSLWISPNSVQIYSRALQRWFLLVMTHVTSTLRSSLFTHFQFIILSSLSWFVAFILWSSVYLLVLSSSQGLTLILYPWYPEQCLEAVDAQWRFVEMMNVLELDNLCFPPANAPFISLCPFTAWKRHPVGMVSHLSFLFPFSFFSIIARNSF